MLIDPPYEEPDELQRAARAQYRVVKNTLLRLAAKGTPAACLDAELKGPTAVALVTGDPVAPAKALVEFAKAIDAGYILNAGGMGGLGNIIITIGQTSSIAFPFSRLSRELFWEMIPQPGKTITDAVINNTSSVSYLRKYALGAKLDDGLFRVMQSGEGREALREALLLSCFSEEAAALLTPLMVFP